MIKLKLLDGQDNVPNNKKVYQLQENVTQYDPVQEKDVTLWVETYKMSKSNLNDYINSAEDDYSLAVANFQKAKADYTAKKAWHANVNAAFNELPPAEEVDVLADVPEVPRETLVEEPAS